MKSKWLITGGAGYIGSHIAALAARANIDILVIDDLSTGFFENIEAPVEFEQISLLDKGFPKILSQWKPSTIVHCAGIKYARLSIANPLPFYERNTIATFSLAKALQEFKINNLIFSSSCSVYGNPDYIPVNEQTPLKPISPYGNSKLAAEKMLSEFSVSTNINFTSIRYFNVAGNEPGKQDRSEFNLFPILKNVFENNLDFHIRGENLNTHDGTPVRDYIDVRDVATAHILIGQKMESCDKSFGPLNLSTGIPKSVYEIFVAFRKFYPNWNGRLIYEELRTGDPVCIYGSSDLITRVSGWQPKYDLDSMVSSIVFS